MLLMSSSELLPTMACAFVKSVPKSRLERMFSTMYQQVFSGSLLLYDTLAVLDAVRAGPSALPEAQVHDSVLLPCLAKGCGGACGWVEEGVCSAGGSSGVARLEAA